MEKYRLVIINTKGKVHSYTENHLTKLKDIIQETKEEGDWLHFTIINVQEGLIWSNEVNYNRLDA